MSLQQAVPAPRSPRVCPYCAQGAGGQELCPSISTSSGAFWCWPACSSAGPRADFQSTLSTGLKHCLTAPQLHPSPEGLTYDTHRQKRQHCAAHTGLFKAPNSLSVYQICYKLLEDRKFGFLIYFLTEGTQNSL